MRIICKGNTGLPLTAKHFENGYTPSSVFDVTIEKEYIVYAISLWKGLLLYLIISDWQQPHWYPAELFEISRSEMPPDWYFAFFSRKGEAELNAICGYYELINVAEHFDELSNSGKEAIEIFEMRKVQIDEVS